MSKKSKSEGVTHISTVDTLMEDIGVRPALIGDMVNFRDEAGIKLGAHEALSVPPLDKLAMQQTSDDYSQPLPVPEPDRRPPTPNEVPVAPKLGVPVPTPSTPKTMKTDEFAPHWSAILDAGNLSVTFEVQTTLKDLPDLPLIELLRAAVVAKKRAAPPTEKAR